MAAAAPGWEEKKNLIEGWGEAAAAAAAAAGILILLQYI